MNVSQERERGGGDLNSKEKGEEEGCKKYHGYRSEWSFQQYLINILFNRYLTIGMERQRHSLASDKHLTVKSIKIK